MWFAALVSLLLSLALTAVAQPGNFSNANNPFALFHTPQTTFTTRNWPGCAYDVHALVGRGAPADYYQFGGRTPDGSNFVNTLDYSSTAAFDFTHTNTFTPTFTYAYTSPAAPYNPLSRVAPMTVVLSSGRVVTMGGKVAPNWAMSNDVIYSDNKGHSWSLATSAASWTPRSDASIAVEPKANNVVLVGGETVLSTGVTVYLNDVWISSAATPTTWTLQTNNPGFPIEQQAPITFLYDGVAAGGTQTSATLVMYCPSDNNVYHSYDLGRTWSKYSSLTALANPQQAGRLTADVENYLYMAGGVWDGPQVFFSKDKGYSWALLDQATFYPGLAVVDPVTTTSFTYGCLAISYKAMPSAPNGYHKQLIEFGGSLSLAQDINTWLGCITTSSSSAYTSVVAELVFPGETVTQLGEGVLPNNTGVNQPRNNTIVFHDATQQILTFRNYPDCTADVHAAITKSSNVRSWQFGGFDANWGYVNSTDYAATGNWNQYEIFSPTFNAGSYSRPSTRAAAGAGLLANNVLLLFGGKDTNASLNGLVNDVYSSSDNGRTYNLVTYNAPWTARSDMAVAVMPGTNVIVMGGGQTYNYVNVADFWYCEDGVGRVWKQGAQSPTFGPHQNAALVAMYDNRGVSSAYTVTYSTLIINVGVINAANQDAIYMSKDAGVNWQFVTTAPWSLRLRHNFVADMDNYLFMLGGTPGGWGDLWFSPDYAKTWTWLRQAASSPAYTNVFTFQGASEFCVALRYSANTNSPGGYHKQLVLFGSPNLIQVSQRVSSSCVKSSTVNVVYAEIMSDSEISNPSFTDALGATPPAHAVPQVAFHDPSAMMPQRSYPDCAFDVHAASSGATPMSYSLGGYDSAGLTMYTVDRIQGSNINGFQTINPRYGLGFGSANGRVAALAGVLANGVLLWAGGKTQSTYSNDVWYSLNQGMTFSQTESQAPWAARSDFSSAVLPGTNCIIFTGGQGIPSFGAAQTWFNDVWSSCDGYGASWTLQTVSPPFPPHQQAAIVALYDGSLSSAAPTNTIVFYTSYDQYIRTSNNMGATWNGKIEAPWASRQSEKFVADLDNFVYMVGGSGLGDIWYSWDKGTSWARMAQTTSVGYNNAVTLSSANYACTSLIYSGSHKTLMTYSGWIEVYSSQTQVQGTGGPNWFSPPVCSCNSLSGFRSLLGDLIFPGETLTNLPTTASSNSGNGNQYSAGATAGIAVGVAVGVALLCCLLFFFVFGAGATMYDKSKAGKTSSAGPSHSKFDDEVSTNQSEIELNDTASP